MSTSVTWNGSNYSVPASGETGWSALSSYLVALAGGTVNPMTTAGDIIYCSATGTPGTPARLAKGTGNQLLGMNSGATAPEYKTLALGTTAQSNDLGIVQAANAVTIHVPDASTTVRGAMTAAAQSFGGVKKFEGGVADCADIASSDSAYTLDNTYRRHLAFTGFTASRVVTMPTTTVVVGETWILENRTTKDMVVNASGGGAIDTINTGYIVLVAKQATPTTAAHWQIMDLYEFYSESSLNVNNISASGISVTFNIQRRNRVVTISMYDQPTNASKTNTTAPVTSGSIVSRFRPGTNGFYGPGLVRDNGVDQVGYWQVNNSGTIQFQKGASGTWTSAAQAIVFPGAVTYTI